MTTLHAPIVDVREMSSDDNSEEYLPTLIDGTGFRKVYSIIDGMEGDPVKNPDSVFVGQRMVYGWKNSGLPWTYRVNPERMVLPPK